MASVLKGLLQKVWNGPFYIGALSRPVSVGDALLKTLETLWRAIILILAVLLVAGVALAAWFQAIQPVFFPPLEKRILANASFDDGSALIPSGLGEKPFRCAREYPIKVAFTNTSSVTVGSINFSIEGRAANRSTNVVQMAGGHTLDSVIAPGYTTQSCWSVIVEPGFDPKDLFYEVDVWSASETDLKFNPANESKKPKSVNAEPTGAPPTGKPSAPEMDSEAQMWAGDYAGNFEGEAEGDLSLSPRADGRVSVALSVASAECTGEVSGIGKPANNRLVLIKPRDESGKQCRLTFSKRGDRIEISEDGCMYYHGFHCSFSGQVAK